MINNSHCFDMYPTLFVSSALLLVVTRMKLKKPRKIASLDIAKL